MQYFPLIFTELKHFIYIHILVDELVLQLPIIITKQQLQGKNKEWIFVYNNSTDKNEIIDLQSLNFYVT